MPNSAGPRLAAMIWCFLVTAAAATGGCLAFSASPLSSSSSSSSSSSHHKQQSRSAKTTTQGRMPLPVVRGVSTRCCIPFSSRTSMSVRLPMTMDLLALDTESATTLVATTTAAVSSSLLLLGDAATVATQAWVQPTMSVLDPLLNFYSLAMLSRVVLSWYPETNAQSWPWVIVTIPTNPLLRLVKNVVPPAFGVDITPVFWLAIFTFVHEILLGQQGLLVLKLKYGI